MWNAPNSFSQQVLQYLSGFLQSTILNGESAKFYSQYYNWSSGLVFPHNDLSPSFSAFIIFAANCILRSYNSSTLLEFLMANCSWTFAILAAYSSLLDCIRNLILSFIYSIRCCIDFYSLIIKASFSFLLNWFSIHSSFCLIYSTYFFSSNEAFIYFFISSSSIIYSYLYSLANAVSETF